MSRNLLSDWIFSALGLTGLAGLFVASLFVVDLHAESPAVAAPAIAQTNRAVLPKGTEAEAEKTDEQAKRFALLEKTLSGAALVGHSTMTGSAASEKGGPKLEPERYELKSVKHLGKGQWLFTARIAYGDHDVTLPLTLPVRWAGDTPVITVDNVGFPGLGTYTARVMIYADHYAGFWSGGNHGGHLFGVIEKPKAE